MLRKAALAFAGMVVLLAGTAAGAAADDSFTISPGRISATSVGSLTFTDPAGRLLAITCNVTVGGTLASRADKLGGTVIGGLTSATASGCSGGTVAFLSPSAERPWPILYNEAIGTLPTAVTGLQLTFQQMAVGVTTPFGTCLYRGDLETQLAVTGTTTYSGETITSLVNQIGRTSGGILCPTTGVVRGAMRLAAGAALTPAFAPAGALSANPKHLRFLDVPASTSAEAEVVFTNDGDDILLLDAPVVAGGEWATLFTINDVDCDEAVLFDGDSCTLRVRFEAIGLSGARRAAHMKLPYIDLTEGQPFAEGVNLVGIID
jgi:hypothetical protein